MFSVNKPQRLNRILFLLAASFLLSSPLFAGDEYTGQFVPELEPERDNLDKVVFQPVAGQTIVKLPAGIETDTNVTFAFLYNPNNEKLEVPALLIEPAGESPYLWVDANLNKSFEGNEKFPLKREEEDSPYLWNGTINISLQKSVFKTFPLYVRFFRGVKWDEMRDEDRLLLQSSEVYAKGYVDLQGKKTLIAYNYSPRERKISASRSKVALDCNGDGEIDWGRFSGEAGEVEDETLVFRIGSIYVSHKKADVEKNTIVLKGHPMTDYKRLELKVGDTFPDFEYKDFKGQKRRLSEFRGKYVLMDFWAIWCGPCRREMPYQKAAYQRYNARGFEILGMNADEADYVSQTKAWLDKNNLDWTQATRESIMPVMRMLRIHLYPTTLLLDPEGKVVSLDERKKGQLDLTGKDLLESLQSVFFPAKAKNQPTPTSEKNSTVTNNPVADTPASAEVERPTLRKNPARAGGGGGAVNTGNIRLPAPPAGFTWKAAEKIKMFSAVPEDWKYTEEATSDGVKTIISEDDAAAVEVVTTVRQKVSGSVTELATTMMDKITKGKQVISKQQNQFGDQTQLMFVWQEGNQITFYLIVANTKTNSLRISTFDCPIGRMSEIGQKAQTILSSVILVE